MTKYIENLNLYLDARKIKQTYLSMKTGIDAKKMSRILNGVQDITGTDMEKISAALGENTEYFLRDPFPVPQMYEQEPEKVTFLGRRACKGTGKDSKYFIEIIRKYRRSNECKGKILKHIEVVFII